MDIHEGIRTRRSVRKYQRTPLSHDDIEKIIESALWAPSGLNNQPWRFKIITDPKEKDGLSRFTSYGSIIKAAPAAVCVFLDKNESYDREKDIMAIGACIQNMLLAAWEKGVGSCWLGEIINQKKEVRAYCGVASNYELMAVVTFGYPQEESRPGKRNKMKSFLI